MYNELFVSKTVTKDSKFACMFFAIFENNISDVKRLKFWNKIGRNHLIFLVNTTIDATIRADSGAAVFVSSSFSLGYVNF